MSALTWTMSEDHAKGRVNCALSVEFAVLLERFMHSPARLTPSEVTDLKCFGRELIQSAQVIVQEQARRIAAGPKGPPV